MKKTLLFLATAMTIALAASCKKDPTPTPTPKPDPTPTPTASTACLITAFSVTSGDLEIVGQIFNEENYIEITYNPEDATALSNATAKVTISEKATISPDPATIKDWTSEVKLTVTAEDKKTTKTYSVKPAVIQYTVSINPASSDGLKLVNDLGAEIEDIAFFGGNAVAFCSTDKIVTSDGRVYDLELKNVGKLNRGEIPADCGFVALGNDDNGILIAAVGYGDAGFSTAGINEFGTPDWYPTVATRIYAWKDGFDKAPVKIYEEASRLLWMNVSGDLNDKMVVALKQDNADGKHSLLQFEKGALSGSVTVFSTGKKEIDKDRTDIPEWAPADKMNYVPATWRLGQTAGGTVSPLGNSVNDALYVYGQTLSGLQEEDPTGWTWNGEKYVHDVWGKDGNAGMKVAVREGYNGGDMILRGKAEVINGGTKRYGGLYGWGNVCINGNIKAFSYSGVTYAAIAGSDWNEPNFTIVNVTESTKEATAYLLETQGTAKSLGPCPLSSVAYVYNPATDEGEVVVLFALSELTNNGNSYLRRFTISRKAI